MANRRMIYQDFFEDDYFGTVDPLLRLTWIGLITAVADDQGRILDNSSLIKAKVFVYDRNINEAMIDKWLCKLHDDGKIVRYETDGKRLIQIVNWWTYQTPAWANYSKYPAPQEWMDKVRCHVSGPTQGGNVETLNWDKEGGFVDKTKELRSYQGSKQDNGIDDVKLREVNDDMGENYSAFQAVWENETGKPVAGFTNFCKMVDKFIEKGVTPDNYRTAIKEQSNSDYPVKSPTSVETWALGLVTDNGTSKKKEFIGPDGEVIKI